MSNVLVIGGHGRIALLLESRLTAQGDAVTAVIRNPAQASDVAATGATPKVADVESLDVAALTELVRGYDAVVWSAGAGGGDPARTYAVDRDAAVRTIDACVAAAVRRVVMVSYFGAATDHGVPADNPFHAYAEAKAAADEHLRASGLQWTILGPSALTAEPPTGRIDAGAATSTSVPRADVAAVIAATLSDPSTIGRTIVFNTGEVAIATAIAGTVGD